MVYFWPVFASGFSLCCVLAITENLKRQFPTSWNAATLVKHTNTLTMCAQATPHATAVLLRMDAGTKGNEGCFCSGYKETLFLALSLWGKKKSLNV